MPTRRAKKRKLLKVAKQNKRLKSAATLTLKCLKRVLRYVKSTLNFKLVFKPNIDIDCLHGYIDSDWGGYIYDRKFTTGYVFKLFNCSISWASKKQQTVSISSTESANIQL